MIGKNPALLEIGGHLIDFVYTHWQWIISCYLTTGLVGAISMMRAIAWLAREEKRREHPMVYVGVFVSAVIFWAPVLCLMAYLVFIGCVAVAIAQIGTNRKDE